MGSYWPFINPFGDSTSNVPLLREAFPDWKSGSGIFSSLAEVGEVPWADDAESEILDIEYFGNRSGGKFVAPVIINLLGDDESLSDANRTILAKIIWTKYKEPWSRLWATNIVAYNPIHNYDMTETRHLEREDSEDEDETRTSVDSTTHGKKVDDTITHGKTLNDTTTHGKTVEDSTDHGKTVASGRGTEDASSEITTHGKTIDAVDGLWGLNSGKDSKPSDKSTTVEGGSTSVTGQKSEGVSELTSEGGTTVETTTEGGTTQQVQTEGGSTRDVSQESGTTRTDVTESNSRDLGAERVEDETLRRSGNIGVTTSQKMVASEREIWLWNFFDQVYKDIDSVLALPFYDPCRI